MPPSGEEIRPTYHGFLNSTLDALLLFEAVFSGSLSHVSRRPHDRERPNLIRSGNIFVYEESASGIKRWTDGVHWSPSRIQGNYLQYRELEAPFPPGEKKKAMKRKSGGNKSDSVQSTVLNLPMPGQILSPTDQESLRRQLIGSLVESYSFKPDGKIKRTISYTQHGVTHHCVAYYYVDDVINAKFTTPSRDPRFRSIWPRNELFSSGNWRAPMEEFMQPDPLAVHPMHVVALQQTGQLLSHQHHLLPQIPRDPWGNATSHHPEWHHQNNAAHGQHPSANMHYAPPQGAQGYHHEPVDLRPQQPSPSSPSSNPKLLSYESVGHHSSGSNGEGDLSGMPHTPALSQQHGSFSSVSADPFATGNMYPTHPQSGQSNANEYNSFSSQESGFFDPVNSVPTRHGSMGAVPAYDLSASRAAPRRRSDWQLDVHDNSPSSMTRLSLPHAESMKREADYSDLSGTPVAVDRMIKRESVAENSEGANIGTTEMRGSIFPPGWEFSMAGNSMATMPPLNESTPRQPFDASQHLTDNMDLPSVEPFLDQYASDYSGPHASLNP